LHPNAIPAKDAGDHLTEAFAEMLPQLKLTKECIADAVKQLRSVKTSTAMYLLRHAPNSSMLIALLSSGMSVEHATETLEVMLPHTFYIDEDLPEELKCEICCPVGEIE
jgi:hypothetical protein